MPLTLYRVPGLNYIKMRGEFLGVVVDQSTGHTDPVQAQIARARKEWQIAEAHDALPRGHRRQREIEAGLKRWADYEAKHPEAKVAGFRVGKFDEFPPDHEIAISLVTPDWQ